MKLPDLSAVSEAGIVEHHATPETIAQAAAAAKLRYLAVDLAKVDSKAALLGELAKGLKLPGHFGNNWDALADTLEDRDWLGRSGVVIRLAHASHYRKAHPQDWSALEDLLSEAAEYWKEMHVAFWVFVA